MIDQETHDTLQALLSDLMIDQERYRAVSAAYEQLRQITAISLVANLVLIAAFIWLLTT